MDLVGMKDNFIGIWEKKQQASCNLSNFHKERDGEKKEGKKLELGSEKAAMFSNGGLQALSWQRGEKLQRKTEKAQHVVESVLRHLDTT